MSNNEGRESMQVFARSAPEWSAHAKERAEQRFPGVDMDSLYYIAKRAGKSTKARIKRACPASAKQWMQGYNGRYWRVTRDGVVFVMQHPETVITVFQMPRTEFNSADA